MARPAKTGLPYFPLDCDFLQDRKIRLIRAGYGACGVMIVLAALCRIYADNGYYTAWSEEDEALLADELGCGCTPGLVHEVVQGCCKRSIFDGRVLAGFGVLTSRGIQRRYMRAVAKRDKIVLTEEYWLLDEDDMNELPASTLVKVTFRRVSGEETGVSGEETRVSGETIPQSKVKESKVKVHSLRECVRDAHARAEETSAPGEDAPERAPGAPTLDDVKAYARANALDGVSPQRFYDYYAARGWRLRDGPIINWQALMRSWQLNGVSGGKRPEAATDYQQRSYAPGELEQAYTDIMREDIL